MVRKKVEGPAADQRAAVNAHPHSGSKHVGITIRLRGGASGGSVAQFAVGAKWRWARVLDDVMLEVFDPKNGAILFQSPRVNVESVSGEGYSLPLWISREYPLP